MAGNFQAQRWFVVGYQPNQFSSFDVKSRTCVHNLAVILRAHGNWIQ